MLPEKPVTAGSRRSGSVAALVLGGGLRATLKKGPRIRPGDHDGRGRRHETLGRPDPWRCGMCPMRQCDLPPPIPLALGAPLRRLRGEGRGVQLPGSLIETRAGVTPIGWDSATPSGWHGASESGPRGARCNEAVRKDYPNTPTINRSTQRACSYDEGDAGPRAARRLGSATPSRPFSAWSRSPSSCCRASVPCCRSRVGMITPSGRAGRRRPPDKDRLVRSWFEPGVSAPTPGLPIAAFGHSPTR